jgi:hypothetical protein
MYREVGPVGELVAPPPEMRFHFMLHPPKSKSHLDLDAEDKILVIREAFRPDGYGLWIRSSS